MNQMVPLAGSALPAAFQSTAGLPDMNAAAQANLQASFAVVGYKGKNWRVRYRGEENLVMDSRGVPDPVLDVVIVGISPQISKQFYDKRYSEGDDAAPDCFSVDGVTPDAASPKKQCEACAVCPQNSWGSRITEAGKKAKACQDSRRLAVVPRADIENDAFGGPMLLRVPPMSLANLAKYCADLAKFGAQPYMVQTRLSFDHQVAYPQVTFTGVGWLDDADSQTQALEAIKDPQIDRMLTSEVIEAAAPAEASPLAGGPPAGFGQPPAGTPTPPPAAAAPAPAPKPTPPTPTPAAAQAAPVKKASPFNTKPVAAEPAQTAQPVQQAQPEPAAEPTPQVQSAPNDMASAIDDLLNS